MFLNGLSDRLRTLRTRLTFGYCALLAVGATAVFILVYFATASMLEKNLDEELTAEVAEWARIYDASGLSGLKIEFDVEVFSFGGQQVFCRFFGPDSSLLLSTDLGPWPGLPAPPRELLLTGTPGPDGVRLETLKLSDRPWGVRTVYYKDEAGHVFQFGHSEEGIRQLLDRFRIIAILGAIALTLVGGSCVYLLSARSLRGLDRIAAGMQHATRGDFSHRIASVRDARELEVLAHAFNHMQDRIQSLVEGLRDVSINVAHDLRSPLTRIRCVSEAALTRNASLEDPEEALGIVVEESDRMIGMIGTLLTIAEAESGLVDYTANRTDLRVLVDQAVTLFQPVATEKEIAMESSLPPGSVMVRGDESRLQRVVANLLENAISYTPPGGSVRVRVITPDDSAVIEVLDTGIGIPETEVARVFDRFYRGDRSRAEAGNGLGLSYVSSVVRAHGGEVAVQSEVGRRTCFRVSLPRIQ